MNGIVKILAVILIAAWVIGFIAFTISTVFQALLVVLLISVLLNLIKMRKSVE
jgi:hypothetical protein